MTYFNPGLVKFKEIPVVFTVSTFVGNPVSCVICILIILHCILYLLYCILFLPFCMLYLYTYNEQCVLYTVSICVQCTVSCIFKDLKFILYLLHKSCLYKIVSCIHFFYIPCTVFCILPKNEF